MKKLLTDILQKKYGTTPTALFKKKSHPPSFLILSSTIIIIFLFACSPRIPRDHSTLPVSFTGDAKIETGGPYVGVSFHHSAMIPQRISFYYPVANSIDHSRDYWTRDTSYVAEWLLKIGDQSPVAVGKEKTPFKLTPASVVFTQQKNTCQIKAAYEFCLNKPAMILSIQISNTSDKTERFEFSTLFKTSIRTCHTFRRIDRAESTLEGSTAYFHFPEDDADRSVLFVANGGDTPAQSMLAGPAQPSAVRHVYIKNLKPGESMNIVQIIGSSKMEESRELVAYLQQNNQDEVRLYEKYINDKAFGTALKTGDPETDHSAAYAKAVMAANVHFLEDEIVPMPCPAEYNFYFTHDALVTDLAAVCFDIARIKSDLDYIIRHASAEHVIPHAYYWKDGKYVTEFADSDNWNNFWFVQVAAKYLRHSGDSTFVKSLLPYIRTSVENSLHTLEKDYLMWSYRPDWWDIGHNYGPRTYMTTLAIKSLRDYIYLATALDQSTVPVQKYASLADSMQTALVEKLWHDEMGYLINYHNDGSLDGHYYIGSLLAAHYGLLDKERQNKLVQTATSVLLDEKVGIYNVWPMDFEEWRDFMKFAGNEAGKKYYYFNGGIWPQGNAWYAMALIANRERSKAAEFIDNTLSLHGIMEGPNGQPAYYEVRNANRENPEEYGTVDKPQFLWAGAWYLNSLYQLFGVTDNGWNIALDPYLQKNQKACSLTLYVNGNPILLHIEGRGDVIEKIHYDKKTAYSAVFPENFSGVKNVTVKLGDRPQKPCLLRSEAQVKSCQFVEGALKMTLKAYEGHHNKTIVISPVKPVSLTLNGRPFSGEWAGSKSGVYYKISIHMVHSKEYDELVVNF
ncbi:MAG: hypothetical protein DRP86_02885 [Candidatus Neomarinimicrobiota bacterium]|nr:MAG: hypothetical protein DRP86_02885 [Candidatus Neomarinimicrobiota bacterium]